jgi:hypothetical protein
VLPLPAHAAAAAAAAMALAELGVEWAARSVWRLPASRTDSNSVAPSAAHGMPHRGPRLRGSAASWLRCRLLRRAGWRGSLWRLPLALARRRVVIWLSAAWINGSVPARRKAVL